MSVRLLLLLLWLMPPLLTRAQTPTCAEVVDFVKSQGSRVSNVSSYTLSSSWLTDVTAYRYESTYFVIAKIKRNDHDFSLKSYVFCGVPYQNWNKFTSYYTDATYGERFHAYIMDYVCDCG